MLAELDQIKDPRARLRFTLGAARLALIPPRSARLPGRAAIVLAGGACAAGAVIHRLAPAAGASAAVVLPGLPAVCVWAVLARQRLAGGVRGAGRAVRSVVLAGLAACVALALWAPVRYPQAGGRHSHGYWQLCLVFALALTGYLWLSLRPPPSFAAGRRNGRYGLAAAVVMMSALTVAFLLHQGVTGTNGWTAALSTPLAAGALAGRHEGGVRNGAEVGLWAGLLGGLALFIVLMASTYGEISWYARDPSTIADAHQHGVASPVVWIVGDNLGGSIIALVWIPALSIILGTVGGVIGESFLRPARHSM